MAYRLMWQIELIFKEVKSYAGWHRFISPIARALVGKEEGDVVVVKTPSGSIEYEIDEVKYI